jgi:hypothetical protein
MKSKTIELANFSGLSELSIEQMELIDGGGEFWERVSFTLGATAKVIYTFAKDAMTYQHSLPPNLKK